MKGTGRATWFETREEALLTMRTERFAGLTEMQNSQVTAALVLIDPICAMFGVKLPSIDETSPPAISDN
jgi:hypothetical protein